MFSYAVDETRWHNPVKLNVGQILNGVETSDGKGSRRFRRWYRESV